MNTHTQQAATKASNALQDFANGSAIEAAEDKADDVAKAFELAGDRISTALERAAKSGEFSFNSLAESVSRDLTNLAITELFTKPLEQAIGGLGKSFGASLTGGSQKPAVNVSMNISGVSNPDNFKRSQGQISAGIARAVADGQRFT